MNSRSATRYVLTYDPGQRLYFIGRITSDVQSIEHELFRARQVEWSGQIVRDALKQSTRNSLGAISTLFTVRGEAAADVNANTVAIGADISSVVEAVDDGPEREELVDNIEDQSNELLEDRIASLDWEQMQQLVARLATSRSTDRNRIPPNGDWPR